MSVLGVVLVLVLILEHVLGALTGRVGRAFAITIDRLAARCRCPRRRGRSRRNGPRTGCRANGRGPRRQRRQGALHESATGGRHLLLGTPWTRRWGRRRISRLRGVGGLARIARIGTRLASIGAGVIIVARSRCRRRSGLTAAEQRPADIAKEAGLLVGRGLRFDLRFEFGQTQLAFSSACCCTSTV
jgi:hypothetical protein